jgi:hypothetical protein
MLGYPLKVTLINVKKKGDWGQFDLKKTLELKALSKEIEVAEGHTIPF